MGWSFGVKLQEIEEEKNITALFIFQVFIQPFSTVIYMYSVFVSMQELERDESKGIEVNHR